jgi:hypothetical protein
MINTQQRTRRDVGQRQYFAGGALFDQATFTGSARFGLDAPSLRANFAGARFAWGVPPEVARFVVPPVGEVEDTADKLTR